MEFFRIQRDIPFMRYAPVLNVISALLFVAAVFFLITRGLHLSIEFSGGTVMQVQYPHAAQLEQVRDVPRKLGYGDVQVQTFGNPRDVVIRLPLRAGESSSAQSDRVMAGLRAADPQVQLVRTEFVGPQVGSELATDGVKALAFVIGGIMLYLALRFEWKFSIAAIVANLHDVVIVLGFFAFFQWEFSLPVLAAVLAVLGYSVNESVVIFDRVRENFRKYRKYPTVRVIDSAITNTISRTIITHGATLAMAFSMFLFGGPALHYFALALIIGISMSIYSSVFVAAAIAMWLRVKREDLLKSGSGRPKNPNDPNAGAVV